MTPPWLLPPGPYSGIGSRSTPPEILGLMVDIGRELARRGLTLRSGAAEGADTAFEVGAVRGGGGMGIWLPWPGFERRRWLWAEERGWGPDLKAAAQLSSNKRRVYHAPTEKAERIAAVYHLEWSRLGSDARALMARNVHQVLGAECTSPARFVVCWTPDGATDRTTKRTGGTGQAIRIAAAGGIPMYNLQRDDHREMWEGLVRG